MLVFGKMTRPRDPRDLLSDIEHLVAEAARAPADIRRHGALVAAFIEAGALLQGLADADFAAQGCDANSPQQEAATALLLTLGGAVDNSWRDGFRREIPDLERDLAAFTALPLPAEVATRWPEGFSYYALYPEAYAVAARRAGLGLGTHVIGLRSIGAPLAAMVAAGLGSDRLTTVRPIGHPFGRTLSVSEDTGARLHENGAAIAVVDEGPGLSGSSFGGTLDALQDLGVPEPRITLFPSHDGPPGPKASEAHRARWGRIPRHLVSFDELVLHPERPEHAIGAWFVDLVGRAEGPLETISGGEWRRHLYLDEAAWPPVNAWQERRKFLLRARGRTWHLKFAGLGAGAARKAERAGILSEAGFTPVCLGLRHGFLLEHWHADAQPLAADRAENTRWIDTLGRYLGFRARHFPATGNAGAHLDELLAMARHNVGEALGQDWVRPLDIWTPDAVAALGAVVRPVETDNRMQPWKWLSLPDGRLLKSDSLDHHAGHDLVGCQDIAWDIVGAVQEFGFEADAQAKLTAIVEETCERRIDPRLIAFLTPCYLAFQVGALILALEATSDAAERQRLQVWRDRQTARLCRSLDGARA